MEEEETTTAHHLLRKAQAGDQHAANRFLRLVEQEHMGSRIAYFRGMNVLVQDSDIEAEFMLGCYKAMDTDRGIGDSLLYILWKGECAVKSLFRRRIRRGVRGECSACFKERIRYRGGNFECWYCAGPVETWMVEGPMATESDRDDDLEIEDLVAGVTGEEAWEKATYPVQLEELRSRMEGREVDLFDELVTEGYRFVFKRGYRKELANTWGTTQTMLRDLLESIRRKTSAYLEEIRT